MHSLLQGWVAETLRMLKRNWERSLELGCGTGDGGALLRSYTRYLVGVDIDHAAVEAARNRGGYDEVYVGDARQWPLEGFDSVFMYEVIEHVSKEDGYRLLEKCSPRYTMVSTPWWSFPFFSDPGHKCLWSEEELRQQGFETATYSFMPDVGMHILYGGIIIGCKNSRGSRG